MPLRCAARAVARRWMLVDTARDDSARLFCSASSAVAARAGTLMSDSNPAPLGLGERRGTTSAGTTPWTSAPWFTPTLRGTGSRRGFTASGASHATSFYDTLGVRPGASSDELKKAYRREAMKWHPDRHPEGPAKANAEKKFKQVSEAYQALSSSSGDGFRSSGGSGGTTASSGNRRSPSPNGRASGGGSAYRRDDAGNTWAHGGTDYSRNDADRVFREMFGDNPFVRDFVKEFTRTGAPRGFPGGFPGRVSNANSNSNASSGMSPEQWADLARNVFGNTGSVSVREEIVTRADGRRVVRKTTTTRMKNGTSVSVEERVVGAGGQYDYYGDPRNGNAGVPHSSRVFENEGNEGFSGFGFGRAPPPGSNPGTRASSRPAGVNAELASVAGRLGRTVGLVARGFAARLAQVLTRQILTVALRVLARILFRR